MTDLDKILSISDREEGFSVQQTDQSIVLFFNGYIVSEFPIDDIENTRRMINQYIGMNKLIFVNYEEKFEKMTKDIDEFLTKTICYYCGKKCRKMCKYASTVFEKVYYSNWMQWVSKN